MTTQYGTGTGIQITGTGGGTGLAVIQAERPARDGNEIFDKALRDIFKSPLGDDAVYTPSGGVALPTIRVLIDRSVHLQPQGMDAQIYERGTTIEVMLADVPAEPNRGDTFVIGTETFTVQSIDSNDGMTVLMVVKSEG